MGDWKKVRFKSNRNFQPSSGKHETEYYTVKRGGLQDKLSKLRDWVRLVGMTVGDPSVDNIGNDLFNLCRETLKEHDYIVFRFNQGQKDVYYRWVQNLDEWKKVSFKSNRNFQPFSGTHETKYYMVERAGHQDKCSELTDWVRSVGMTVGERSVYGIGNDLFDLCHEIPQEHNYIVFQFNQRQKDVYYRWGKI